MDLINAMQSQYTVAKKLLRVVWVFLFALVVLGVASLIPAVQPYANFIATTVFALQIGVFGLRYIAGAYVSEAEKIRRVAMLYEGLGMMPSRAQLAQLHVQVALLSNGEPEYAGQYYNSSQPVGPRRLIDIVSECAFFTSNNARFFAYIILGCLAVAVVITVLGFLTSIFAVETIDSTRFAARVFITAMTFWVVGDLSNVYFAFCGLAHACERTHAVGEQTLGGPPDNGREFQAAISLFADYNAAVVKAPPIPSWVYNCRRRLLNDAWNRRNSTPINGRLPPPPEAA